MTAINQADAVCLRGAPATAVYLGSTKVFRAFRPTDIAGCMIWMDASRLGLANGAAVSSWPNLVSGGAQPTVIGSPAPVLRANALNTNQPVVRVTQGSGRYRVTGSGVDKDWTLIYVGRKWSFKNGRVIAAVDTAANLLVGFHGNEMDQCYIEGWLNDGNAPRPPASAQWKLYSADSTSTAVARFFSNGTLLYSGAATPAKGWGGSLCINGYTNSEDVGVSQQCDCEIAELVQYNRKLSDAERQQVEKYLREKWFGATLLQWKPTDLGANLLAWFDSSDMATIAIAGSNASQWNSKTGAMVFSQGTDANRPTYASQGGVNFPPTRGMVAANGPASYDVAMVCKPNGRQTPDDWRTLLRSANCHEMIIESTSTRLGTYNAGFLPAGGLTWDNVDGLAYARVAPSTATQISRDGGALTSTVTALPAASAAPTMFGCYNAPPPSQSWGLVREIMFATYNSEADRQKMEGYLAHKWGLAGLLPSGHPYKTTPP